MSQYKSTEIVEAIQLPSKENWNLVPFLEWAQSHGLSGFSIYPDRVCLTSMGGGACPNEWVIKHETGFFTLAPEDFEKRYVLVAKNKRVPWRTIADEPELIRDGASCKQKENEHHDKSR